LDSAGNLASGRKTLLESSLRLRMWGDAAYGTLGSDGKYVFAVEDLKLENGMRSRRQFVVNPMRPANAAGLKPSNRLAAYEILTGKLMWQVGGAANQHELRLGGAFFLGPPLPLMGDLYVLAELNGEIRLLALDSSSGELLWDQQLTVVNRDVLNDPVRRLAGASPSYADGILVCPTSDKSVVALELTTRSLLWGYIHSTSDSQPRRRGMFMAPGQFPTADAGDRWIDSSVVLAEGRVLITPVKSDELHCLDLADGRLVWKRSRNDDLYLACVYDGKAVLVGRRGVRALALKDGSVAWKKGTTEFPRGSSLTGTGFRGGNRYYVPLDTATVVAIDLNTGRLVETFESRERAVPGNLVCYKDKIVSQRADGVEAFHQLDLLREEVEERLAAEPDDAEALTWAGEIMWNDGNLPEAVESFRAAWKLSPSIYTRRALREVLFEGLRGAFETYRGRLDEIRPLIDDVSQQATLLRLVAMGLEDAGEYEEALNRYRELIELDDDGRRPEPIDEGLALRRDRWIRVQMSALRQKMPEESRNEIDRFARELLDVAIAERTPEAVRGFLDYFDSQPIAREARDILGGLLKQKGRLLELELLLEREARSSDPERAGRAIAEMAAILAGVDRWGDAAVCYRRLAEDFADVICRDGKTGKELYRAVEAGDPVSPWLTPESPWPVGKVEFKEGVPKPSGATYYGNRVVNYQYGSGPFFRDLSIEIHQTPRQLVARDGLGNIRWRLPMDTITPREQLAYGREMMRVDVLGHMLLLSMGNRILAIDTLDLPEGGTPRVVWSQELQMPDAADIRRQQFRIRLANMPGGLGRFGTGGSVYPTPNGTAAVSPTAVCFKRFRSLVAVDPVSGEEIWTRRDVHPDSVVFGDHEYVLVVGPDKTEADVFRVADGKLLGTRTVPAEIERITTVGRRVLTWRVEGPRATVRLIDPWEEGTPKHLVWVSDELDSSSRMFMLEDEAVAVYEPSGRFVVLDLADGHPIIDQQLRPEIGLAEIYVLRCPDQYLLIAHARQTAANTARRTYRQVVSSVRIARGLVYAFDLSGKKMWPEPVEVTNQFLALNQPRRLPVLTFVCMLQEPPAGNTRPHPKTVVLCLDKRTGRVVYSKEFADPTSVFQLSGDPEKKTVGIRLQKKKLTLTFTDQPIPPKEDSDEGSGSGEEEDSSVVKILLGAVKKALMGLAGDETDQPRSDEPGMADEPSDADEPSSVAKESAAESDAKGEEGGGKEGANEKPE
jgi:outer membrane protein assembly factor BamB